MQKALLTRCGFGPCGCGTTINCGAISGIRSGVLFQPPGASFLKYANRRILGHLYNYIDKESLVKVIHICVDLFRLIRMNNAKSIAWSEID